VLAALLVAGALADKCYDDCFADCKAQGMDNEAVIWHVCTFKCKEQETGFAVKKLPNFRRPVPLRKSVGQKIKDGFKKAGEIIKNNADKIIPIAIKVLPKILKAEQNLEKVDIKKAFNKVVDVAKKVAPVVIPIAKKVLPLILKSEEQNEQFKLPFKVDIRISPKQKLQKINFKNVVSKVVPIAKKVLPLVLKAEEQNEQFKLPFTVDIRIRPKQNLQKVDIKKAFNKVKDVAKKVAPVVIPIAKKVLPLILKSEEQNEQFKLPFKIDIRISSEQAKLQKIDIKKVIPIAKKVLPLVLKKNLQNKTTDNFVKFIKNAANAVAKIFVKVVPSLVVLKSEQNLQKVDFKKVVSKVIPIAKKVLPLILKSEQFKLPFKVDVRIRTNKANLQKP